MNNVTESSKICMNDTMMEILTKMSEGNPGAMNVLSQLVKETPIYDRANALGWLGPVFNLDELKIYGSRIWILYKDVCNQKIENVITVLRGFQLGILSRIQLMNAISGEDNSNLNFDELFNKVQEKLGSENFG